MKDVIKELVDIDEQAKLYNEETKRQKEKLESDIEKETKKIHEKYMNEAKEKAESEKAEIEKENLNKFQMSEAKRKASAEKLQKQFDDNADKWVNEIVEDILK